jgi:hypothetical protein
MISNEVRSNLKEVCQVLNGHQVDCLLIGGAAVGFYGYQRISGISMLKPEVKVDSDFWYNPNHKNFNKVVKALRELKVDRRERNFRNWA